MSKNGRVPDRRVSPRRNEAWLGGLGSVIVCFFLTEASTYGQSFLAMRGFGEEVFTSDARSAGLGEAFVLSPRNPAYPARLSKTLLNVGLTALATIGTDGKDARFIGDGRPSFLRAQVPLPVGFRVGVGFSERFNQDFSVCSESLAEYQRDVIGRGGIYDLAVALGKQFGDRVAIAAEYCRVLGSAQEIWTLKAHAGNYVTTDSVSYGYHGNALRLGILGHHSILTASGFAENMLSFGLSSRTRTHGKTAETLAVRVEFPLRWGIGLSATAGRDLAFFLEAVTQPNSALSIEGSRPDWARDALRVSLGLEKRRAEGHVLRIGLHAQNWYTKAAKGGLIRELGVSAGSGTTIGGLGSLDYMADITLRSTASLRETVFRIGTSLCFEELWSKRSRRWGR
ncbi:MAG: hypothetical protein ABIK62_04325 [candidate division WOR-3 bacterium]